MVVSGELVNETVRFQARGDMMVSFPIKIINDDIAEEVNVESYSLQFIGSSPSTDRIVFGPKAVVRITDEDSKFLMHLVFLFFDIISGVSIHRKYYMSYRYIREDNSHSLCIYFGFCGFWGF